MYSSKEGDKRAVKRGMGKREKKKKVNSPSSLQDNLAEETDET